MKTALTFPTRSITDKDINKVLLLLTHLNIGDHIIQNGMVRYLKQAYNKIILTSWSTNYSSIKFMYRDDPDIIIDDRNTVLKQVDLSYFENKYNVNSIIKLGEYDANWVNMYHMQNRKFDECFYAQANVPIECKFTHQKLVRYYDREQQLYEKLNSDNSEYVFVHQGGSHSESFIDKDRLPQNIKIIEPLPPYSGNLIFDYLTLIEKAKEVHVIPSSFLCMIDQFLLRDKLYIHHYARRSHRLTDGPVLQQMWEKLL